jgi:hypothetical protein
MRTLFLSLVLGKDHNMEEIKAFLYAWRGSIEQQEKIGNEELAESAMSLEQFSPILNTLLEGAHIDHMS